MTKQFIARVPNLAEELAIDGVSKSLCRKMYEARSQGPHGFDIEALVGQAPPRLDATVQKVVLLRQVLRAAVRRGIEDQQFRELFASDDAIRVRWPVKARRRFIRWKAASL